jgi:hypothetical protein
MRIGFEDNIRSRGVYDVVQNYVMLKKDYASVFVICLRN